jgi:hypothetical protein
MSSTNGAGASRSVSIEQVEALLRSLSSVAGARIITGPEDEVMRIQIQTDDQIPPNQLVRNIQSALLARFGLLIDLASIEFVDQVTPAVLERSASLDAPDPNWSPKPSAQSDNEHGATTSQARSSPKPEPPSQRHGSGSRPGPVRPELIDRPVIERLRPNRIRCRVEVEFGEIVAVGEAEALDGAGVALEVAARAVLAAFRSADALRSEHIELEGVRTVELAGQSYIVAGVRVVEPRNVRYLAGAVVIEASGEEAAALATIHAMDQWST